MVLDSDGAVNELASKSTRQLAVGDRILIETLGGGGFGPAEQRRCEDLANDLVNARLSLESAREIYGDGVVTAALDSSAGRAK
jgi:N-methylhydantoinase B